MEAAEKNQLEVAAAARNNQPGGGMAALLNGSG